jgi:hypothetical protein
MRAMVGGIHGGQVAFTAQGGFVATADVETARPGGRQSESFRPQGLEVQDIPEQDIPKQGIADGKGFARIRRAQRHTSRRAGGCRGRARRVRP